MDTVANMVRGIIHVYVHGQILSKNHDLQDQSV